MSADDVIWVRCQALSDDGCPCARAAGHDDQHWCVACCYSHEFDAYQVAAENVRVVEKSPVPWEQLFGYAPEITDGLSVAEYLESIRGDGPGHDFGEGE